MPLGDPLEIRVRSQQGEFEADAQLCQQSVDRTDLGPASSAVVPKIGGRDVIFPLWLYEGQGGDSVVDRVSCSRSAGTLQEFLQNQSGSEDGFSAPQSSTQLPDLRGDVGLAAPQSQRPDAGVHEEAQPRDRSDL